MWPGEPQFSADGTRGVLHRRRAGPPPGVPRSTSRRASVARVTASGHYTNLQVHPDGTTLFALRDAVDSPPRPVRLDATGTDGEPTELPAPGGTDAPGRVERVTHGGRDGTEIGGVAGAARRRVRRESRAAAAVDPRRPAQLVEQLELALEPVADGRQGLCRAAARSGAVDRLRRAHDPARLGPVGRRAVHRPDGDHRRGASHARHRRDPDRRDGRLVRRLHGQLGRRAHRPVPLHRHARQPVGARPVPGHDRPPRLLGTRVGPAGRASRALRRVVAAPLPRRRSRRRCS